MESVTPALTALASPRRREIVRLVWRAERAAGEIHAALGDVTFGAVSQHLRALAEAGLLESRAEGRRRLYRARPEAFGSWAAALETMWDDALYRLRLAAELEESRRGPRPAAASRRRGGRARHRAARSRRSPPASERLPGDRR
jgi:DNA-binding transcriptional ArsR family regulator